MGLFDLRKKNDMEYVAGITSTVLKVVVAGGIFCLMDSLHKHRRALEVFSLSKAYDEIKGDIPEEKAKELANDILERSNRILSYRFW